MYYREYFEIEIDVLVHGFRNVRNTRMRMPLMLCGYIGLYGYRQALVVCLSKPFKMEKRCSQNSVQFSTDEA